MTQIFLSKLRWKNAKGELTCSPSSLSDRELMSELPHYLNRQEESDSGKVFRPNKISTCRVMDGDIIAKVLNEMENRVNVSDID